MEHFVLTVVALNILLFKVCFISGQETSDENGKLEACTDGPSSLQILGVGEDENGEKVVVFNNNIIVYIESILANSTIVLSTKNPSPLVKATEAKERQLRVGENVLIFNPDEAFFRFGNTDGDETWFGGWNQVVLGCPQPLCIDSRLDATMVVGETLLIFRGFYFWSISLNGVDNPPTEASASKIVEHFPTLTGPVAAATSDGKGNLLFFDYENKLHIYTNNVEELYKLLLPPPVMQQLSSRRVARLFEVKPFQSRQLTPSGLWVVNGIDTKYLWGNLTETFQPEGAFLVQVPETKEETVIVLGGSNFVSLVLPDALKVAVGHLLQSQDLYRGTDLSEEVGKFLQNSQSFTEPRSVRTLHPDFPTDVHSAFNLEANTFLNHGWKFFQLNTAKFSLSYNSKLDEDSFTVVGSIMDSILRCKPELYPTWGFESYKQFVNSFEKLLEPVPQSSGPTATSGETMESSETIERGELSVETEAVQSRSPDLSASRRTRPETEAVESMSTEPSTTRRTRPETEAEESGSGATFTTSRTRAKTEVQSPETVRAPIRKSTRTPETRKQTRTSSTASDIEQKKEDSTEPEDEDNEVRVPKVKPKVMSGREKGSVNKQSVAHRQSHFKHVLGVIGVGIIIIVIIIAGAVITIIVAEVRASRRKQPTLSQVESKEDHIELQPMEKSTQVDAVESSIESDRPAVLKKVEQS